MKTSNTFIIIIIIAIIIYGIYNYKKKGNYHNNIDTLLYLNGKDYMDRHRIMKLQYTGDVYQRLKMISELSNNSMRFIDIISRRLFPKYGKFIYNNDKKQIYAIMSLVNHRLKDIQRLSLKVASVMHQQIDAAARFNILYNLVHNGLLGIDVLKSIIKLYGKYNMTLLPNDRTYILELSQSVYKKYSRILALTDSVKSDVYKFRTG